jgi:hypothetical protein
LAFLQVSHENSLIDSQRKHAVDAWVAVSPFSINSFDCSALGLSSYQCPYELEPILEGDVVVIASRWVESLELGGIDVLEQGHQALEAAF